ncbi:MAG: hypothetical protein H0V89_02465 [Deltaproteobacteria bacterium]|nr:hypothetical protein [Deltaproteobacteria bacterium]
MIALVAVAWAAETDDPRARVEQARLFVKKGWWDDARAQLELAVASENGRLDPEAWILLATVAFQLCDVPAARHAADRAHSHSRDLVQAEQAAGLRDWLDAQFGTVTVGAPYDGIVTKLDIVLTSTLFDPELKLYLSRLRDRSARSVALPLTVGLPAGSYRINGVDVDVPAGGEASVVPRSKTAVLQATQVELGFGPTFWLGRDLSGLLPVPTTGLAVSIPAGRLRVGVGGAWTPQPFRTATDEVRLDAAGWEIGGDLGLELTRSDLLHVRAALGYAYGAVPGIAVPCTVSAEETVCGPDASPDLWIHAAGRAHQPRAELAVLYLDHGRGASFGAGLKTSFGGAFGTIPADGDARSGDDSWSFTVADGDARFTGWSLRGLATLTATF